MVKKLRIYRPILGSLLIFSASLSCSLALASQCAPKTAPDPADSLRRLYAAAMKIDRDAFLAELTPDFYAFDGGKRYSRDEFGNLPRALHDKGEVYVWSVTKADTHISCDTAWVAYYNEGTVTNAAGQRPASWLESADLVWRHGAWKIQFFQSTLIKPPPHK